ncbi:(2Fe-2S)-binding protein [Kordiimonas sp. SCSIO 12610]|uniref:(2Fe-2S)-binding protein n=1 Tax=Kordiimonas sp. SCSIO 12610 TaxID=2829597 RepID=UPI002109E026|nr:(2Fe-2S)-binding protein [Kordiimonas sp. SCSIO 12610]UTW53944.1 (2Fe-2S)-binding protein [Kordiimonas sp. SCSIO 12610]
MQYDLKVNGETHRVDVEGDTPLLWVLRDELGFKGVKFGCGVAACGACTVHMDGTATRTCVFPVEDAVGTEITTIEGISEGAELTDIQNAWIENQVPQCGYCQSGMIMAVTALLEEIPNPSDEDIDASITNICRCGSYQRIRKAIHAVADAREKANV